MPEMTEREIITLARRCQTRVCSTEEHHGCPYGDDSMLDCVNMLEADVEAVIDKMLDMADAVRSGKLTENRANLEGDAMYMENRALQRRLAETEKYIPHCCDCCSHQQSGGRCALLPEGDEFSIDYTGGYDRDDCEHWELRIPTK